MKKNVMMRVAALLLVCVLATTCGISGTFAKYVTEGESFDQARVAKWGVVVNATADMFKTEYAKDDAAFTLAANTVISADTIDGRNRLLAPGTNGTLTDVKLSGTPEVAVRVSYVATLDIGNWILNGTEYYCPVIITVEGTDYYGMNYANEAAFEAAVKAAIEDCAKYYEANTNLATVGTDAPSVSWRWVFEVNDGVQTDAKDTILGDQAAAGNPAFIDLTIETIVTQVN